MIKYIILIMPSLLLAAPAFAAPPNITIFTNSNYPIAGIPKNSNNIQVMNLDQQAAEEKKLAAKLPRNKDAAAKEVKRRISHYRPDDLQRIWAPRILAQKYDIRKIPAIVFNDGEALVYGVTDVNKAIEKWLEWKNVQK